MCRRRVYRAFSLHMPPCQQFRFFAIIEAADRRSAATSFRAWAFLMASLLLLRAGRAGFGDIGDTAAVTFARRRQRKMPLKRRTALRSAHASHVGWPPPRISTREREYAHSRQADDGPSNKNGRIGFQLGDIQPALPFSMRAARLPYTHSPTFPAVPRATFLYIIAYLSLAQHT